MFIFKIIYKKKKVRKGGIYRKKLKESLIIEIFSVTH